MISVINFYLLIVIFLILAGENIAQDYFDDQFKLGKKLFDEEKYYDAVTEFKRLVYFNEEGEYIYEANRYIGLSYKFGGKFSDALRYLTIAEINAKTVEEIYDCKIEIIKINILRRTTEFALKQIESTEKDPRYKSKKEELNYWRGLANIFADDWENAAKSFALIDENHELKVLSEKTIEEQYSVSLAKTLSYIIPGAGQFYTGEYLSGLISLGWNVLWGYLTIEAFVEDRIFDGIVVGSLLWMRFYQGSIENAEKFARQKNLEITNKALNYLQYEYEGAKP
ncbi:MAG TPA: hypothetical protein VI362_05100 [Ignavibacteriaceae bacterium]|nr:hypothetical protein [Ignavibacteriaceae bacterium]